MFLVKSLSNGQVYPDQFLSQDEYNEYLAAQINLGFTAETCDLQILTSDETAEQHAINQANIDAENLSIAKKNAIASVVQICNDSLIIGIIDDISILTGEAINNPRTYLLKIKNIEDVLLEQLLYAESAQISNIDYEYAWVVTEDSAVNPQDIGDLLLNIAFLSLDSTVTLKPGQVRLNPTLLYQNIHGPVGKIKNQNINTVLANTKNAINNCQTQEDLDSYLNSNWQAELCSVNLSKSRLCQICM